MVASPSDPLSGPRADTAPPSLRPLWRPFLAAFAVALLFHALMVLWMPTFADYDAWFHARYAQLLGSGGARWNGLEFPWLTESAFADMPTDWALGWHWLVAPLTWLAAPFTALKTAVIVQAALLTGVFHALVVRNRVAWPWAWTALLTVGCAGWLFRTHMGRPTPLVVALLLVLFGAIAERRLLCAATSALAALLIYQVPVPPALVAASALVGVAAATRAAPWRLALCVAGGAVAAIVLHPGFWSVGPGGFLSLDHATFRLWDLMRGSLDFAAVNGRYVFGPGEFVQIGMPQELAAPDRQTMLREFAVPLLATLFGVLNAWRRRRDPWSVGAAVFAVVGLVATWRSGRFLEYWHPFAMLSAALVGAPLRQAAAASVESGRTLPTLAVKIVVVVLGALSLGQIPLLVDWVRYDGDAQGDDVRAAVESLDGVAEPGDIVFHGYWDEFAPMFYWDPRVRFITGMDPWYMLAKDPRKSLLLARCVEADFAEDEDLRTALTEDFGARFALLWRRNRYDPLEAKLKEVPWAKLIHDDPNAAVFELTPR